MDTRLLLFLACLNFVYITAEKIFSGKQRCNWMQGDCLTDESINGRCERNCSRTPPGCLFRVDRFGIGLKYQCHCFNIADCDFDNNGYCKGTKCFFGYSGPTCQRRLYYESFAAAIKIYMDKNVWHRRAACQPLPKRIRFPHVFRINWVKFNIYPAVTKRIYVTSSMGNQLLSCTFNHNSSNHAGVSSYTTVSCTGDISTDWLHINGSNACIENLQISGCPKDLFGLNCTYKCRCKNGATCQQITGHCKEGCEPGRVGSWCQNQTYENIALHRPAFQSSNHEVKFLDGHNFCSSKYFATASFAVDGKYNQNFQLKSCSRTKETSSKSYWYVKLDRNYTINQIRIYTHSFFHYSLNVFVGDKNNPCSQLCNKSKSKETILHISCQRLLVGETVCIQTAKIYASLALCEVEVIQCHEGFYGPLCQHRCDDCKNKKCDQVSGNCTFGTLDGQWNSSRIPEECHEGFYGPLCQHRCDYCKDKKCDQVSGNCTFGTLDGQWNITRIAEGPAMKLTTGSIIAVAFGVAVVVVVVVVVILRLCISKMKRNPEQPQSNDNEMKLIK